MSLIGDLIPPDARLLGVGQSSVSKSQGRWRTVLCRPAFLASGALTMVLVGAAASFPRERAMEAVAAPIPTPVWMDVARPYPMYALQSPEFSKTTPQYFVRRMSDDTARQDRVIFGAPDDRGPYLRILAHRGPIDPRATFFVEAARQASEAGWAIEKPPHPETLPTRFGTGEYAPLLMTDARGGPAREGCSAFVIDAPDVALRIAGLACGPEGGAFDRRRLSCLVGRLDLLGAGDDTTLKTFFAESELYRDPTCPQRAKTAFVVDDPAGDKKPSVTANLAKNASPIKKR